MSRISSPDLLDDEDPGEYYREPGLTDAQARELLLDDTVLPAGLTLEEEREACRALKGAMLRQEIYALDGTEKGVASLHRHRTELHDPASCRPKAGNRHAVFFTHAREAISYHYERNPADPRVAHAFTLEVDDFGNVLKSAAVGYGRRQPDPRCYRAQIRRGRRERPHHLHRERVHQRGRSRTTLPRAVAVREPQLTRLTGLDARDRPQAASPSTRCLSAGSQRPRRSPTSRTPRRAVQKRLIEHVRTLYRPNDLAAPGSAACCGRTRIAGAARRELQARLHAGAGGAVYRRRGRRNAMLATMAAMCTAKASELVASLRARLLFTGRRRRRPRQNWRMRASILPAAPFSRPLPPASRNRQS